MGALGRLAAADPFLDHNRCHVVPEPDRLARKLADHRDLPAVALAGTASVSFFVVADCSTDRVSSRRRDRRVRSVRRWDKKIWGLENRSNLLTNRSHGGRTRWGNRRFAHPHSTGRVRDRVDPVRLGRCLGRSGSGGVLERSPVGGGCPDRKRGIRRPFSWHCGKIHARGGNGWVSNPWAFLLLITRWLRLKKLISNRQARIVCWDAWRFSQIDVRNLPCTCVGVLMQTRTMALGRTENASQAFLLAQTVGKPFSA